MMLSLTHPDETLPGQFCWIDLAANHAANAQAFYGKMFGWTAHEQAANGGHFTRLRLGGRDVGSLYQLNRALLDQGVASHWTPYIRVENLNNAVRLASVFGGTVIVRPFEVAGVARIAVILDSVGAQLGLWEPLAEGGTHAEA
jgi:uncharacterized protein